MTIDPNHVNYTIRDSETGKFRQLTADERLSLLTARPAPEPPTAPTQPACQQSRAYRAGCLCDWLVFAAAIALLLAAAFGLLATCKAKAGYCSTICDSSGRNCSTYCTGG